MPHFKRCLWHLLKEINYYAVRFPAGILVKNNALMNTTDKSIYDYYFAMGYETREQIDMYLKNNSPSIASMGIAPKRGSESPGKTIASPEVRLFLNLISTEPTISNSPISLFAN